jgi:hypothetical protein
MKHNQWLPAVGLILFGTAVHAAEGAGEAEALYMRSKPESPIGVSWDLAGEPVVGQPLEIVLRVSAEIEVTGVQLTLGVDDPLALIDPPGGALPLANLGPDTPVEVVVTVLPLVAETQYLRVSVGGYTGDQPQLRALSIPIRFESVTRLKDDQAQSLRPAEEVHSLPAVETVR